MASFKFRSKRAHRPPTYECSWLSSLRALPKRVISPPVVQCPRKHRSCKTPQTVVPIFRVLLEDILDGKHLPPLSLKDFEEYLLFEERSAENLYTRRHRAWFATATVASRSLALSFTRAKSTFFSHSSPHELNLASIHISNFLIAAEGQPHPHPSVFDQIQRDVEHMLQESLIRFVAARTKNAGKQRVWCALIGGIGTGLLALIPILVSILNHKPRTLRLAALPILWLGATIFLSSIHGICFIIYLLGDARQLYPFELSRPPISSPRPINDHSPQHIPSSISGFAFGHAYTSSTSGNEIFEGKEKPYPIHGPSMEGVPSPLTPADIYISSPFPESPVGAPSGLISPPHAHHARNISTSGASVVSIPTIPPYSPAASSPFDTAPFIAPWDPNLRNPDQIQDSKSGSWKGGTQATIPPPTFNFDDLPGRHRVIPPQRSTSLNVPQAIKPIGSPVRRMIICFPARHRRTKSTPLIAPLTRIWSPVITRAQWEIVMRSAAFGLVFAAIITGTVLAVPAHAMPGQSWAVDSNIVSLFGL
ncbi:unnamed protein product [Rhizoctonia solani]|uniref:RGS domain-containing protein n=1 Tax=Rhizoctonia solani TaxID=456999 RepID=A0A8H3DU43_9AGAM|nr:unnamed protein product [Rhizoctonia solani]